MCSIFLCSFQLRGLREVPWQEVSRKSSWCRCKLALCVYREVDL